MITLGIALGLALAIYAGLSWPVRSVTAYFTGVAGTLAVWAAAFGLRQSYTTILLVLLGVIGSVVFGLAGARAWWRARSAADEAHRLWLLGSTLAVTPLVLLAGLWAVRP